MIFYVLLLDCLTHMRWRRLLAARAQSDRRSWWTRFWWDESSG